MGRIYRSFSGIATTDGRVVDSYYTFSPALLKKVINRSTVHEIRETVVMAGLETLAPCNDDDGMDTVILFCPVLTSTGKVLT